MIIFVVCENYTGEYQCAYASRIDAEADIKSRGEGYSIQEDRVRGRKSLDPQSSRVVSPELATTDDIRRWFKNLLRAGINFHPEDTFAEVVNSDTGKPVWDEGTAFMMDQKMNLASRICFNQYEPVDLCGIAVEVFDEWEDETS